jgi:hypothetical protein
MRESAQDIAALQSLIDQSIDSAGPFIKQSFDMPALSLSAPRLITHLQGAVTIALGTVTSDGRPRVAPVIALFVRGSFFIPTVSNALRTRHVVNNPNVSLTLYEGNDFAILVHGTAEIVGTEHEAFEELVSIQMEVDAGDVRTWGDPVFIKIIAERIYSFARYPDQFPES